MKPRFTFHPYNQDHRPARANSKDENNVAGMNQGQDSGASQARNLMAGRYEQALPALHVNGASITNTPPRQQTTDPGNPYPVVPSTSTSLNAVFYPPQPQVQPHLRPAAPSAGFSRRRISPFGNDDSLDRGAASPLRRAPQPQSSRHPRSQATQTQPFSEPGIAGDASGQHQWDATFDYAPFSGVNYSNLYPPAQMFPAPRAALGSRGQYDQNAATLQRPPQMARLLQPSLTAQRGANIVPGAVQTQLQSSLNNPYFGIYAPAPATTNFGSQRSFQPPQFLPAGLPVPFLAPTSTSTGVGVGAIPVASCDGGHRRAPYQSAKAKAAKWKGTSKKTRSSLQDENRDPITQALPDGYAECPYAMCRKVMKKVSIPRHLKTKLHGGAGKVCPLCKQWLSRGDSVKRHVDNSCPSRHTGTVNIEKYDDDDDDDDDDQNDGQNDEEEDEDQEETFSGANSDSRPPLIATQAQGAQYRERSLTSAFDGHTYTAAPPGFVHPTPPQFGQFSHAPTSSNGNPTLQPSTVYSESRFNAFARPLASSSSNPAAQDVYPTPFAFAVLPQRTTPPSHGNGASTPLNAGQELPLTYPSEFGRECGLPAIRAAPVQRSTFGPLPGARPSNIPPPLNANQGPLPSASRHGDAPSLARPCNTTNDFLTEYAPSGGSQYGGSSSQDANPSLRTLSLPAPHPSLHAEDPRNINTTPPLSVAPSPGLGLGLAFEDPDADLEDLLEYYDLPPECTELEGEGQSASSPTLTSSEPDADAPAVSKSAVSAIDGESESGSVAENTTSATSVLIEGYDPVSGDDEEEASLCATSHPAAETPGDNPTDLSPPSHADSASSSLENSSSSTPNDPNSDSASNSTPDFGFTDLASPDSYASSYAYETRTSTSDLDLDLFGFDFDFAGGFTGAGGYAGDHELEDLFGGTGSVLEENE